MTEAVDSVRKSEHRQLQAKGDETLKRTKYLWLYSEENLPESSRAKFAVLRALHLKTGRAWAIKESLRDLWDYRRKGWVLRHWRHWYFWATHSRLKPVVTVARMIHGHLDNVLGIVAFRGPEAVYKVDSLGSATVTSRAVQLPVAYIIVPDRSALQFMAELSTRIPAQCDSAPPASAASPIGPLCGAAP
jgi:transposase